MKLNAEIRQAEALLATFGASAAQRASDRADSEAMNLCDDSAASWRRVTALILASHQALELVPANHQCMLPQIAFVTK
jgi:hypothetical protein